MTLISTYQDLLREIEIYKSRLEDLERESYAINRLRETNKIDIEIYIVRKWKMDNETAILQAIIDDKRETKEKMLEELGQLEGLEYKIAYKRFVEGKPLNLIAAELNFSDSYVMKKSAAITKKRVKKE